MCPANRTGGTFAVTAAAARASIADEAELPSKLGGIGIMTECNTGSQSLRRYCYSTSSSSFTQLVTVIETKYRYLYPVATYTPHLLQLLIQLLSVVNHHALSSNATSIHMQNNTLPCCPPIYTHQSLSETPNPVNMSVKACNTMFCLFIRPVITSSPAAG